MADKYRRMSFALTPEIEDVMDEAKRMFYNQTQSDIVRMLVTLGLGSAKQKALEKEQTEAVQTGA